MPNGTYGGVRGEVGNGLTYSMHRIAPGEVGNESQIFGVSRSLCQMAAIIVRCTLWTCRPCVDKLYSCQ